MKKFLPLIVMLALGCSGSLGDRPEKPQVDAPSATKIEKRVNPGKVIHVIVALCDNENQGIVPVPAHLGNGDDAARNLYWGAGFGVRTYFMKSNRWKLLESIPDPKPHILERLIFRHRESNTFLVADAYRGSRIKDAIGMFFAAASGAERENVAAGPESLQILGGADLIAFIGHDGLMDFDLERPFPRVDNDSRDAIVLACMSRRFFGAALKETGAKPLLLTSNLMAPEAYSLHDAIEGWIANESPEAVRDRAAAAYAKYQRISLNAAKGLLVTGF